MLWFWEDARAWLADRRVYLYETTEEPLGNVYGERWLRPLEYDTTPAAPPYAVCLRPDPSLRETFASVVRPCDGVLNASR